MAGITSDAECYGLVQRPPRLRRGSLPAKAVPVQQDSVSGVEWLRVKWCFSMHRAITWPHHGGYQCRTCGRLYAVPWGQQERITVPRVGHHTLASSEL